MGGRRGDISLSWDVIIAVLFFVLIGAMLIMYVLSHTNSDLFFSRYYSVDVATSAQVVAAGNGDVYLRYSAMKPDNHLSFWLDNGKVAVGPESATATKWYGQVPTYDGAFTLKKPTFLALRTIHGALSIGAGDLLATSCPTVAHAVPPEKTIVSLHASAQTIAAFKSGLAGTAISVSDTNPTLQISIKRVAGQPSITYASTNEEGAAYACHVTRQLALLSGLDFTQTVAATGSTFTADVTIATPADATLTDEQIGRALAYALAVHFQ